MTTPYVCTLDEATQKKALEELNEDPKNRQGAIDAFREWILQQKHFTCPTDNVFLLAFLRARKFSQLAARQLLENFLYRRQKLAHWYKDLDTTNPESAAVLDDGCCMLLPGRDKDGRRVFLLRPGYFDVKFKKYQKNAAFRTIASIFDSLYLSDEMSQVHGTVSIVDFSKMTIQHQTKISMEERKNFIQTWQKNYPARIKALHMYNPGPFMEFVMMIVKAAMSEKIQKRLVIHGSNLESLYKHIPMEMFPEEYLPDEYTGPNGGSEKSIAERMKADLTKPETRDRVKYISGKNFSIDMKQKDTQVPEASFRKLNVD